MATLITYPYIRAKVILQTRQKRKGMVSKAKTKGPRDDGQEDTILSVWREILATDGVAGLYTGCDVQILKSTLASALLMMAKEQITQAVRTFMMEQGMKFLMWYMKRKRNRK